MVERFDGRVRREVLGTTLSSHRDREIVLGGVNVAHNGQRQRVRDGLLPEMVLRQRLDADPASVNPTYRPPKPGGLRKALRRVAGAEEISQPDTPPSPEPSPER